VASAFDATLVRLRTLLRATFSSLEMTMKSMSVQYLGGGCQWRGVGRRRREKCMVFFSGSRGGLVAVLFSSFFRASFLSLGRGIGRILLTWARPCPWG
jgi:hypothetical protein